MSGAGSYAAGTVSAGFNEATDTENPTTQILAVEYDAEIRGFRIIADGSIAQVHPIDQEAGMRLTIGKGWIANLPDVGRDLERLKTVTRATAQQVVEDDVKRSVAEMISAGSIRIERVTVAFVSGRLYHAIDYVNLVASDSHIVRTVKVTL